MNERDKQVLHRLFPEFSDEELEEVDETLTRYAKLLARMVERRANNRGDSNRGNRRK